MVFTAAKFAVGAWGRIVVKGLCDLDFVWNCGRDSAICQPLVTDCCGVYS